MALANLVFSRFDVFADDDPLRIGIQVDVQNIGIVAAMSFNISSTYKAADGTIGMLEGANIPDPLAPGDDFEFTEYGNVPAAGNYTVTGLVDSGLEVDEGNETDNGASGVVTIQ